jgi:hypothetical protein
MNIKCFLSLMIFYLCQTVTMWAQTMVVTAKMPIDSHAHSNQPFDI